MHYDYIREDSMPDPGAFTVRIPVALKDQVDDLAAAIDRSRAWVVNRAIEEYIANQAWQIAEIKKGIAEADAGDFASAAEMDALRRKYRQ